MNVMPAYALSAGQFLFIGATVYDKKFGAFDSYSDKLLWEATLPNAGVATPATYMVDDKQFVVIAAEVVKTQRAHRAAFIRPSVCRNASTRARQNRCAIGKYMKAFHYILLIFVLTSCSIAGDLATSFKEASVLAEAQDKKPHSAMSTC